MLTYLYDKFYVVLFLLFGVAFLYIPCIEIINRNLLKVMEKGKT